MVAKTVRVSRKDMDPKIRAALKASMAKNREAMERLAKL